MSVMIDWVTARVEINATRDLDTGAVVCLGPGGEMEWSTSRRAPVRGSHEQTVSMRRSSDTEIEFAGSPAKFLQGHNVFGEDRLVEAGANMILRVCELRGNPLTASEDGAIRAGRYRLLRVDINQSFPIGSRSMAETWVKTAALATLKHRGRGQQLGSTTAIWGAKSRHWSLKAYCKGAELEVRRHQLPSTLPMRTELLAWAADKVRIELMLWSRELKKLGLDYAECWEADTAVEVFRRYLSKLQLGSVSASPTSLQQLPSHLRKTHRLWCAGVDLKPLMSRSTLSRHRQQLLGHGIDVGSPQPSNVEMEIPLTRYLESPAEIPEWAKGEFGSEISGGYDVSGWNKSPVLLSDASSLGAP